jgi:hypothetical protein
MSRTTRTVLSLVAAVALFALPATGVADPGKGKGPAKRCAKTPKVGYSVKGTLVSLTADNPATPASEASVTITVTKANSHARKSGEIADQDAVKPGVQVKGATYTVAAGDAYKLKLKGYSGADTPSAGDAVHITGKIPRTKRKCAADGTSTADLYGTPNVRKVTVADRDPDA